ncbi:MAG TPA: BadF/BadG/BcrA/BcrD ATPase family protein [Kofleriaceae bacterium]|nr:BadF/BadG/BcrA/BcrD ATPase family protein [Kofleriaceae bacterium]
MRTFIGIDLGSTTTKAVLLDEGGQVLGRGITNSRSDYDLAAAIAKAEAHTAARLELLARELETSVGRAALETFLPRLRVELRRQEDLTQLRLLADLCADECRAPRVAHIRQELESRVAAITAEMIRQREKPNPLVVLAAGDHSSDFFRDRATTAYRHAAERHADLEIGFDDLMSIFDKAIIRVENTRIEEGFGELVGRALDGVSGRLEPEMAAGCRAAVERTLAVELEEAGVIGTGYGRARLPFPKESIRSEILCHGLGAHHQFPATRTVLDIGGQDTKAIQVDERGIVTSFQMNDRCAAGCGRYLGYIADEMSLGVHELGPLALQSERNVKITSTCTVFAGAELRDRLSAGQRREDILAGLHRAIIIRTMSLLARSGGVKDEFTFTGGVANNPAAVLALRGLVEENYGPRTLNISPGSIYTGALGAALFSLRAAEEGRPAA